MNKIFFTGDQDGLVEACRGVMVNYFFDSVDSIKSASSNAFTEKMLRDHQPDSRHYGVHLVGMGASEFYGFNKNGDYWPKKEALEERHNTFVSHGYFFREHNNSSPKLKIGDIKASAYNPELERVELVVHGDKKKAEAEYERAKAGKTSSYSMSARVPEDYCSICNKASKKSKDYCPHLKESMTQYLQRFKKFAYAINLKPTFFDISDVSNPADRIAYALEYLLGKDDLQKAASGKTFVFSDQQAEAFGVNLDARMKGCVSVVKQHWLEKLAREEAYVESVARHSDTMEKDAKFQFAVHAAPYAFSLDDFTEDHLKAVMQIEPDVFFRRMVKNAAVLPFLPFYAYATKQALAEARSDPAFLHARDYLLPTLFRTVLDTPANSQLEDLFDPCDSIKSAMCNTDDAVQNLLDSVADKYSIKPPAMRVRILRIRMERPDSSDCSCKSAAYVTEAVKQNAVKLVRSYALYKVAFCEAVADSSHADCIDGPACLLLMSHHHN